VTEVGVRKNSPEEAFSGLHSFALLPPRAGVGYATAAVLEWLPLAPLLVAEVRSPVGSSWMGLSASWMGSDLDVRRRGPRHRIPQEGARPLDRFGRGPGRAGREEVRRGLFDRTDDGIPVGVTVSRDGDEVVDAEDRGDAVDGEQCPGEHVVSFITPVREDAGGESEVEDELHGVGVRRRFRPDTRHATDRTCLPRGCDQALARRTR